LLSNSIPHDWSIFIKEHRSQFIPQYGGNRSVRSWDFYNDLSLLPNVRMIPTAFPSLKLIDQAKAVATVTGTAGWEAIIRGKPAITFGYPWYRGCEGVYYTPTQASCREAVSQIERGYRVDLRKVRLFAQIIEQLGCTRYFFDQLNVFQFQSATKKEYEQVLYSQNFLQDAKYTEAVQDMTRALQNFYRTHWKTSLDEN